MSKVVVELGDRAYPITIDAGLLNQPEQLLSAIESEFVCVVSSNRIYELYGAQLKNALGDKKCLTILFDDGEQTKSLASLDHIYSRLLEENMPRSTCLIALGGGVIGDLTGFAAATYMRGVSFVQIPTTLLAQVDSSVGGKTAVNHALGKNMIGAFYQPKSVLIDTDVLNTLPDREFNAGLAEVIKYGLIADSAFFDYLEKHIHRILAREKEVLAYIIQRSCEIKAAVVAEDERESGRRAILNFGHTMGHAIELVAGLGEYLHGEAVAIGMVHALAKSIDHFGLDTAYQTRLLALLAICELPCNIPEDLEQDQLLKAIMRDKKNTQGSIRWVLLDQMGHATVVSSAK